MWTISLADDPLLFAGNSKHYDGIQTTKLVTATCALPDLFSRDSNNDNDNNTNSWTAFLEGGRVARVALADFIARHLGATRLTVHGSGSSSGSLPYSLGWELLGDSLVTTAKTGRRHARFHRKSSSTTVPFMLERTDIWCSTNNNSDDFTLSIQLRIFVYDNDKDEKTAATTEEGGVLSDQDLMNATEQMLHETINLSAAAPDRETLLHRALMGHVATAVLQERMRAQLATAELNAVAFVANQAILPRRSGASTAPMASPPAVPFQAPADSPMNRTLEVPMGKLHPYLVQANLLPSNHTNTATTTSTEQPPSSPLVNGQHPPKNPADVVSISGLVVPRGVSLIVGGGYHGKSTLLRTIQAGVYNKIPGDGREFCVTVTTAVTVRAEDGRYVNNANVSGFISNLPIPPPPPTAPLLPTKGDDKDDEVIQKNKAVAAVDTAHFSTGEASGSTSQAANVVDAIEMGCSAFLVDEDVSAANFMARDGRMRALVMDESITPLLYRVNGLYNAHGISSIVVVGGVGDWLDVPHSVILMDRYTCRDATAKARSVSRQFSHGHVQYGGRGVVHRLEWEKSATPIPRRPTDAFAAQFPPDRTVISLLDGSNALALYHMDATDPMDVDDNNDDDNEDHFVDMSRCEQLLGNKSQLYGCGACLVWLLQASRQFPQLGIADLLAKLDETLDEMGIAGLIAASASKNTTPGQPHQQQQQQPVEEGMIEKLGFAYRPRRFEVGQALTRLRGIQLEEIPIEDDGSEAAAAAEAERKKRELMELWNARRRKNNTNAAT